MIHAFTNPNRRPVVVALAALSALRGIRGVADAQAQAGTMQQNPVTAIDIALEPDATMVEHAKAANARLLKEFPKGFALDATHHPHVSLLQQFVQTADLDKVYAAAAAVMAKEKPASWKLKAFKYYYIPSPPIGLAGIVVEPTDDLHRIQHALIDVVSPFTVTSGTPAAFYSTEGDRDIQPFIRGPFRDHRGRREVQSACHDRCRHRRSPEQAACRTVPGVHVLPSRSVSLPAWNLRHRPQGTQVPAVQVLTRHGEGTIPSLGGSQRPCSRDRTRPSREGPGGPVPREAFGCCGSCRLWRTKAAARRDRFSRSGKGPEAQN
jgi:hypothetical protein